MTRRAPIGLAPGAPREAAGQDAAKYESTNPVVRRLLDRWSARLVAVVGPVRGTVVDVGVGEGLCLERVLAGSDLAPSRVVGIEYRHDKARIARDERGVDVVVGDAGMVPLPNRAAELVLCIEVLEHLPLVAPAIAELARLTGEGDARCVVSVPWEPWFRLGNLARAKNLRRFGNDPEHVGWFTPARLRAAMGERFEVVRVVRAFPWLVAEGRRPRR
jgi:ubiquinone/menaquinone biosynthesis C-methylase UbiE